MVQLASATREGRAQGGEREDKSGSMGPAGPAAQCGQLAELVEETRALLRRAFEADLASERAYSRAHYDRLMEPGAPLTCWRYLVHSGLRPKDACELIKATLVWRKHNRLDELGPQHLAKDFWLRAPIGFTGRTRHGHDLIYCVGKNYRKPAEPGVKLIVKQFIMHLLDSWDRRHQHDMHQMVVVFDVTDTGYANIDLDFVAWLISIRDHFPNRFKAINIIGIPFLVRPLIRLIISWLPDNYKRICECGTLEHTVKSQVDDDNLPAEVGGLAPDTWRLAPPDAPWAADSPLYDAHIIDQLNQAICFNTPSERIAQLEQMQRRHDADSRQT